MTDLYHGRIRCPESDDQPCAECERQINAAESARYSPTGTEDRMSDREADRYERNVLGL